MPSCGWPRSALRTSQAKQCSWTAESTKDCRVVGASFFARAACGEASASKKERMRTLASRIEVMSGEGALSVYARAKELEQQGRSIIHLELGEPDFHPSASVNDALKTALDEGKDRYCAVAGVPSLRDALATYLHETRNLKVSS